MGIYAQTNFIITCDSKAIAEKVAKKIQAIKDDKWGNSAPTQVEVFDETVEGFMSSGRSDNLEYQCQRLWKIISKIQGVEEASFPFMSEADGCYFTKEK